MYSLMNANNVCFNVLHIVFLNINYYLLKNNVIYVKYITLKYFCN